MYPNKSKFTFDATRTGESRSFCKEIKSKYLGQFSGSEKVALLSCPGACWGDKDTETEIKFQLGVVDLVIFSENRFFNFLLLFLCFRESMVKDNYISQFLLF